MSNHEPETQQEKEQGAASASSDPCRPPGTPGRAGALKRFAKQCAEQPEGQKTPAPVNTARVSGCSCGC